jgi:ABC-2 type transport system ATP-binding protein
VSWLENGARRSVVTEDPTAVLRDLLATAPTAGVPGLTVTRPGLEDVYLQLVGAVPTVETVEGDPR